MTLEEKKSKFAFKVYHQNLLCDAKYSKEILSGGEGDLTVKSIYTLGNIVVDGTFSCDGKEIRFSKKGERFAKDESIGLYLFSDLIDFSSALMKELNSAKEDKDLSRVLFVERRTYLHVKGSLIVKDKIYSLASEDRDNFYS